MNGISLYRAVIMPIVLSTSQCPAVVADSEFYQSIMKRALQSPWDSFTKSETSQWREEFQLF